MTVEERLNWTWTELTAQIKAAPTPQLFGNAVNLIRLQHLIETGKEPDGDTVIPPLE